MNPESICKIDQLLEELNGTTTIGKLPDFLDSVYNAVNLPYKKALFDLTNGSQEKKFISVCFLRLLCCDETAILDTDLRLPVFTLFDDQIGSIYHRFGIGKGTPNHEKSTKLREAEREVLDNFDEITDSIVNLGSANTQRQPFMQALNFEKNKLFLEQFVTPSLINKERIGEVFEKAVAYHESSTVDRVTSYQNIETVFNSFLDDAARNPSIFTKRCIAAPVKKIYDLIQDDFKSNDATQPTEITTSLLDRKYPFDVKGGEIELKFRVENRGPGYALDVQIECIDVSEGLKLCNPIVTLGALAPRQSSDIVFEIIVENKIEGSPDIIGEISWRNFDNSRQSNDFDFELPSQRTDLDWDQLRLQQPYSLRAIQDAKNLVGRTEAIDWLSGRLSAELIESSIIRGQKRVGKTSIARIIQTEFDEKEYYTVISISIGDLDKTTPQDFVRSLGDRIVRLVSRTSNLFRGIEKPKFEGALYPLIAYFEDAIYMSSEHKFIIILDEFDEIPLELVRYTDIGRTFFLNIRALSDLVGFLLVGGENMQTIAQATDTLNQMEVLPVDYFDKGRYWKDFQELVRRPVTDTIEFNDKAINVLYEMTEGNPFYTKYICRKLYTQACIDRNAYISEDNIEQATQVAIEELELNQVNHFWKDGISVDDPAKIDEIETQRRKFLIAFAEIKRKKAFVNKRDLQDSEILTGVATDQIIENYMNRGILVEEAGHYRWKPRFFEDWLIERGYSMMTSTFLDENAIKALMEKEQEAYVTDSEILALDFCGGPSKPRLYQGSEIATGRIRPWLDQFEGNIQKRLMFSLLQHFDFYHEARVREKIRVLHQMVRQNVAEMGGISRGDRRERRADILLSSFGQPSKSGSSYARIYAAENRIFVNNVVPFDHIPTALGENEQIKALVFVDDIIGSGDSAVESLNQLDKMCGKLISDNQVTVFISAICGLHTGIDELEKSIERVQFDAEVIVSDLLTEADQCFTDQSEVFSSDSEREHAKQIAFEYGNKLRQPPLGYRNSQLLVAFPDNCPNNTLPILWKESTGRVQWIPLFKRN